MAYGYDVKGAMVLVNFCTARDTVNDARTLTHPDARILTHPLSAPDFRLAPPLA